MKISLYTPGKTEPPFIAEGVAHYQKRIRPWARFEVVETPRPGGNMSEEAYRNEECRHLLKQIPAQAFIVALDEQGATYTSPQLATQIQKWMNNAPGGIAFVCGGAYGLPDELRRKSGATLALSRLTFPHQLVRLIFAEQIYRAISILEGHPYHH